MPRLTGFFDNFPQIEEISVDRIQPYLARRYDREILENELGNRILYPQTIPITYEGLLFDLAVLQESLRLYSKSYYNQTTRKLYIPEEFFGRFPDLKRLAEVFINSVRPVNLTNIEIRSEEVGVRTLGTYLKPEILNQKGSVFITIQGRSQKIDMGKLETVSAPSLKVDLKFESDSALLNGKSSIELEVLGGLLGLVVDTRS